MEVQQIPIGDLKPSPMNPRKTFDEGALQDLADNIRQQGLLQPITVRPITDDADPLMICGYEIVCGERRFRALTIIADGDAAYKVPCIIRTMTDAEAFDAMITENLQREDVDPVEEAFAFGQLVSRGASTEEIALRFGKSQRFVSDRIKLNNLIPELLLKVKDEQMAISAALLIAKLNEEMQRKFYDRYAGWETITKDNAVRYCNEIFQYIGHSAWSHDDRDDFDGGCGVRCADCPCNTINAGCLFYEMKADESTARCTNRDKFLEKKLAYMMSKIEAHAADLIKAGEPLEFGKIAVVADIAAYCNDKESARAFVERVKARGYEVFNRDDVFGGYSHYDPDDDRLQAKLANHELFHSVTIYSHYQGVEVDERYYELKRDSEGVDNATIQEGVTAAKLAEKYKKASDKCKQDRATALASLFHFDKAAVRDDELTEEETEALVAYMLSETCWEFRSELLGNSARQPMDNYLAYVVRNPDDRHKIMRQWLRDKLHGVDQTQIGKGQRAQVVVAEQWHPDALHEIEAKFATDHEKKTAKIAKQLDELGYTTDGQRKS